MANPMIDLFAKQGQSPWLDFIRRNMLEDGGLRRYVEQDGIRGVTANPTIFAQAIGAGDDYDPQIADLLRQGVETQDLFEPIATQDIRQACDILRPVFDASRGSDGFVSIEVSPEKAFDTRATIDEAARWWKLIARPNLLVKIPATEQGLPAIEECLAAGININITLIFAVEFYERVMEAYLRALERRAAANEALATVNSVASFFVSRVDTAADKLLGAKIAANPEAHRAPLQSLLGTIAVANTKVAYQRFLAVFGGERFAKLKARGARVQRPLWASTGTKNPAYSDILYVQELIGPDTVNTMPPKTIDAFRDHGTARRTVDEGLDAARDRLAQLAAAGISLVEITDNLQRDGVAAFVKSFEEIQATIAVKAERIRARVTAA
ncbi:MAG TPA: transaldolase [Dehalococcoidia bacterium]|nr:transaldolase [Dehalococcoidia bacterium]